MYYQNDFLSCQVHRHSLFVRSIHSRNDILSGATKTNLQRIAKLLLCVYVRVQRYGTEQIQRKLSYLQSGKKTRKTLIFGIIQVKNDDLSNIVFFSCNARTARNNKVKIWPYECSKANEWKKPQTYKPNKLPRLEMNEPKVQKETKWKNLHTEKRNISQNSSEE